MKRLFFFVFVALSAFPLLSVAQETREVRATVSNIVEEQTVEGEQVLIFEARDAQGNRYRVDTAQGYTQGFEYRIDEGDKVVLQVIENADGTQTVFLADVVRTGSLLWIVLIFIAITIAVGLWRGVLALVGLAITLLILFVWVMPQIISGSDPVVTIVLAGICIMFVNMPVVHGFCKKTFVAFGSVVLGLGFVVGFSSLFTYVIQLTGLANEDASFLFFRLPEIIEPRGLLLAGIILGALGVLDDIAITQQQTVHELKRADKTLGRKELFVSAMRVGRHHIASVVNTLVLAYAGVALPLFLLFYVTGNVDMQSFLNTEVVAEEIVRTLAGTTSLVLLVPISTWFAVLFEKR